MLYTIIILQDVIGWPPVTDKMVHRGKGEMSAGIGSYGNGNHWSSHLKREFNAK